MVYHSKFNDVQCKTVCEMAILPIKTRVKGPAPPKSGDDEDIIDEALNFFKANVLFRNFEVKGAADRVLVYLTLYISKCLKKLASIESQSAAEQAMITMSMENFQVPGDRSFPLASFVTAPKDRAQADLMRQYFTQLRQELGIRLVLRVYPDGKLSKWWTCFSKKKFMQMALN